MRILFKNEVEDPNNTVTATNNSLNYPIANIANSYLHKRAQFISTSSTITIEFSEDKPLNSFYMAYYTASSGSVNLRNSSDVLLYTFSLGTISDKDFLSIYFDQVDNVRKIEVILNGNTSFFVGGIGCGLYYQMPPFLSEYSLNPVDNSDSLSSDYGQHQQSRVEPLDGCNFTFVNNDKEKFKEIYNLYKSIGINKSIYIDLEGIEDSFYGRIVSPISQGVGKVTRNFRLNIRESR